MRSDDKKLEEFYIKTLPASLDEATEELSKNNLIKEALGSYIFSKLIEAQKNQWNSYRLQVTPWEIKKYFPIL